MTKEERFAGVLNYFSAHRPDAKTELHYKNGYQLLVAVMLSAQCTDKRVNMTTPALFERYPTVKSMSEATFDEVLPFIKSISYPNSKTKHLIAAAKMIVDKFNGEIPSDTEELETIPGVGRKTANVIASCLFNQPKMAVDTHVFRVAARIGLTTNAKNPRQAEEQLIKYIPEKQIPLAHHWLILHGRYVCVARNPKCAECGIKEFCKYYEKNYGNLRI